tara:strand:- start:117 stop:572 length:456 start_codon:yes stop_codon:yes gene_type:complete
MARGKQSGIAFGQRTKQKGQSDLDQLISLKQFLKQRFHMDFKREWYVGFDREYGNLYRISETVGKKEMERFRWKNPDLLCVDKEYGVIIVELDGAIHDRKVQKTIERNELFRGAGIKLVVLNIADIKECGETVIDRLENDMMDLIHGYNDM